MTDTPIDTYTVDEVLRAEALQRACEITALRGDAREVATAEIVEIAQAFYDFLTASPGDGLDAPPPA